MPDPHLVDRNRASWRDKWDEVRFGSDTLAGRIFDIVLLTLILLSVLSVLLEVFSGFVKLVACISLLRSGRSHSGESESEPRPERGGSVPGKESSATSQ